MRKTATWSWFVFTSRKMTVHAHKCIPSIALTFPSPAIASPLPLQWVKLDSFPNLLLHFSTISRSKRIWPFSEYQYFKWKLNIICKATKDKGLVKHSYLGSQTWQRWCKVTCVSPSGCILKGSSNVFDLWLVTFCKLAAGNICARRLQRCILI